MFLSSNAMFTFANSLDDLNNIGDTTSLTTKSVNSEEDNLNNEQDDLSNEEDNLNNEIVDPEKTDEQNKLIKQYFEEEPNAEKKEDLESNNDEEPEDDTVPETDEESESESSSEETTESSTEDTHAYDENIENTEPVEIEQSRNKFQMYKKWNFQIVKQNYLVLVTSLIQLSMLVSATTPDGFLVGADGKYIQ